MNLNRIVMVGAAAFAVVSATTGADLFTVTRSASDLRLTSLEPDTGLMVPIGDPILNAPAVVNPDSALDGVAGRFYCVGVVGPTPAYYLNGVSITDGATVTSSSIPQNTAANMEFDAIGNRLYGLTIGPTMHFTMLNPESGEVSNIGGPLTGLEGVNQGVSSLDPLAGRYLGTGMVNGAYSVFSINTATGAWAAAALSEQVAALQFETSTDRLLALMNSQGVFRLAELDAAGGSAAFIGDPLVDVDSFVIGFSALDSRRHRFYFVGDDGSDVRLYSLDTSSGVILSSPIISDPFVYAGLEFVPEPCTVLLCAIGIGLAARTRVRGWQGATAHTPATSSSRAP